MRGSMELAADVDSCSGGQDQTWFLSVTFCVFSLELRQTPKTSEKGNGKAHPHRRESSDYLGFWNLAFGATDRSKHKQAKMSESIKHDCGFGFLCPFRNHRMNQFHGLALSSEWLMSPGCWHKNECKNQDCDVRQPNCLSQRRNHSSPGAEMDKEHQQQADGRNHGKAGVNKRPHSRLLQTTVLTSLLARSS